ncbi:hypothetical protein F8388_004716 [Cannabis sativa]|uniref:Uncharacterized protein n=1 Tax=Cannabis sativa TaxID=3483 RepID=A0A7J6HPU5_CANSA|nr:hypothetical protein F8388_004716 [Cannabis sativa]
MVTKSPQSSSENKSVEELVFRLVEIEEASPKPSSSSSSAIGEGSGSGLRFLPDISVEQLFSLREAQLLYRLSDEHVADLFREHTRKLIEKHISSALTLLKSKTRATYTLYFTHNCLYINISSHGVTQVVEELDKSHPDSSRFTPGVGPK